MAIISIISNSGETNQDVVEQLFERLTCPMPSITGLWNNTGTLVYANATYNYAGVNNNVLTLTCTEIHTLNGFDYAYGSPTLPFAGFGFFIGDWISELIANKLGAFFELLAFVLSPASLNILGFTIDDLSGQAVMFVIAVYVMCYIAIGALIYKIISPFAGAS